MQEFVPPHPTLQGLREVEVEGAQGLWDAIDERVALTTPTENNMHLHLFKPNLLWLVMSDSCRDQYTLFIESEVYLIAVPRYLL
jgi:hypothetical protein